MVQTRTRVCTHTHICMPCMHAHTPMPCIHAHTCMPCMHARTCSRITHIQWALRQISGADGIWNVGVKSATAAYSIWRLRAHAPVLAVGCKQTHAQHCMHIHLNTKAKTHLKLSNDVFLLARCQTSEECPA